MGLRFTEENMNLLKIIYEYGGYFRVSHYKLIETAGYHSAKYKILEKLKSMGYLTSRRLRCDSLSEPITYQVTHPTCKLFGNPDSHYRKKHTVEYAYRALLKSYFCCIIHRELRGCLLTNHDDRVKLFDDNNFNRELYPKKYNKDDSFIHFEEFLLDFTRNEGRKLLFEGEVLYDDSNKNIVLIYVDQYYKKVKDQLTALLNKYMDLILSDGGFTINFLVVVDSDERYEFYKKQGEKFVSRHITKDKVSNKCIEWYFNYLSKYYKTIGDDAENKKLSYRYGSGTLKHDIISKYKGKKLTELSEEQQQIVNEILLKGSGSAAEFLKAAIIESGGYDKSKQKVEAYFDQLFLLEANNFITLGESEIKKKFDIKVYKVPQKIYLF